MGYSDRSRQLLLKLDSQFQIKKSHILITLIPLLAVDTCAQHVACGEARCRAGRQDKKSQTSVGPHCH